MDNITESQIPVENQSETPKVEPKVETTPQEQPKELDNSVIRTLREKVKKYEKELSQAQKGMEEFQVVQQEITKYQELLNNLDNEIKNRDLQAKELFEQELQTIPEDKREKIQKLAGSGSYLERLNAVKVAKELLNVEIPPSVNPSKVSKDEKVSVEAWKKNSWTFKS